MNEAVAQIIGAAAIHALPLGLAPGGGGTDFVDPAHSCRSSEVRPDHLGVMPVARSARDGRGVVINCWLMRTDRIGATSALQGLHASPRRHQRKPAVPNLGEPAGRPNPRKRRESGATGSFPSPLVGEGGADARSASVTGEGLSPRKEPLIRLRFAKPPSPHPTRVYPSWATKIVGSRINPTSRGEGRRQAPPPTSRSPAPSGRESASRHRSAAAPGSGPCRLVAADIAPGLLDDGVRQLLQGLPVHIA